MTSEFPHFSEGCGSSPHKPDEWSEEIPIQECSRGTYQPFTQHRKWSRPLTRFAFLSLRPTQSGRWCTTGGQMVSMVSPLAGSPTGTRQGQCLARRRASPLKPSARLDVACGPQPRLASIPHLGTGARAAQGSVITPISPTCCRNPRPTPLGSGGLAIATSRAM